MNEKHSSVCYIFREGAFSPVREAKPFRNDFGLDLFQYKGAVYEGRTGLQFCPLKQAADIASFIEKHGGLEKVQKLIADSLEHIGLSPRYTRPDEKKKDLFPPEPRDENRVFAKDLMGNKHYYYRFYNENGIELYTLGGGEGHSGGKGGGEPGGQRQVPHYAAFPGAWHLSPLKNTGLDHQRPA